MLFRSAAIQISNPRANAPVSNREASSASVSHREASSLQSTHSMITRSRKPPFSTPHSALLTESYLHTEPKTYNQAKSHSHWVEAMTKEHNALLANHTWDLVSPSTSHNIVGCKWVYKIKRHADGTLERYKARLVAKGYNQEEGIDYFETYSPVVRPTTIRLVLTIALSDRKSTRLNSSHAQ